MDVDRNSELFAMKAVLIDASSAILLYKAGLLETLTAAYEICMVPSVVREVTVAGRRGVSWFLQAFSEGKIKTYALDHTDVDDRRLAALGAGERETLAAYDGLKVRFIIIDDRKGALFCRSEAIPYVNALLCPKILCWSGWIGGAACRATFAYLSAAGRYSRSIIDFARRCSPGDLAFSHPEEVPLLVRKAMMLIY